MNNQVNAQAVIVELQKEIADKALQIAMLKAQLQSATKAQETTAKPAKTSKEPVDQGGNQ